MTSYINDQPFLLVFNMLFDLQVTCKNWPKIWLYSNGFTLYQQRIRHHSSLP